MAQTVATEVNWGAAEIDPRKFTAYSMDPGNDGAGGKWKAFAALGFEVEEPQARASAAATVIEQMRATMPPDPPPPASRFTDWGDRYETTHTIEGPNGRKGRLEVVWQVDPGVTHPRLVTNFLKVHKESSP